MEIRNSIRRRWEKRFFLRIRLSGLFARLVADLGSGLRHTMLGATVSAVLTLGLHLDDEATYSRGDNIS
jgi:hypothetical protein